MTLPVGNSLTPIGTPYHVSQLVLLLLKYTFANQSDPDFPFRYTDNYETTQIIFDTVFNKESEVVGKRPIIIVSRGDVSSQQVSLKDLSYNGPLLNSPTYKKHSLVRSSVQIKILAKHSSEVDILSNEILNFLITCRTILPNLTSILHIDSINVTPVALFEDDGHLFYCIAMLSYVMQYKWIQIDATEILKEIALYFNEDLVVELEKTTT